LYEGYGPGGVALVLEILTDNKNRSAGDVRSLFIKYGGSMAVSGAVSFLFDRKGVILVPTGASEEKVMELALDAGGEDVIPDGEGGFEIRTEPNAVNTVHKALEGKLEVGAPKVVYVPKTSVAVEGETAIKLMKLVDALESNDDVQRVHGNFELDEATLASLSE
jgi:YebC/PmpR family DNA-binding regulatory protein